MKVQLPSRDGKPGNKVIVRWKYDEIPVQTKNGTLLGITTQTTCIIKSVNEENVQVGEEVSGSVKLYRYDVEDKDVARKESLRKVLDQIYPIKKAPKLVAGPTISEEEIKTAIAKLKEENAPHKQLRSLFWDAYLTRNDKFIKVALPMGS